MCPHLEPSIKSHLNKVGCSKCNWKKNKCFCTKEGYLPVAEKIQKQIMQFKTNYRDLNAAKKNSKILQKILKKIESK